MHSDSWNGRYKPMRFSSSVNVCNVKPNTWPNIGLMWIFQTIFRHGLCCVVYFCWWSQQYCGFWSNLPFSILWNVWGLYLSIHYDFTSTSVCCSKAVAFVANLFDAADQVRLDLCWIQKHHRPRVDLLFVLFSVFLQFILFSFLSHSDMMEI